MSFAGSYLEAEAESCLLRPSFVSWQYVHEACTARYAASCSGMRRDAPDASVRSALAEILPNSRARRRVAELQSPPNIEGPPCSLSSSSISHAGMVLGGLQHARYYRHQADGGPVRCRLCAPLARTGMALVLPPATLRISHHQATIHLDARRSAGSATRAEKQLLEKSALERWIMSL